VAGTLFLNSDDLASTAGQNLARMYLTDADINEVARAGVSFRPVEGNTGTNPAEVFVRQQGDTWYAAVFNYTAFPVSRSLNLPRLGIPAGLTVVDLWSGTLSTISGATWNVNLGARQAKLFRLGAGQTTATGPTNQALVVGSSTTLSTVASGTPAFSYVWKKNGAVLAGANANSITINPAGLNDAGTYTVVVTGGNGSVTNSAVVTLANPGRLTATVDAGTLRLNWPAGYTGWRLQWRTNSLRAGGGNNWFNVTGSTETNTWAVPFNGAEWFFRLSYP
jgi:hypothetical protein